MSPFFPSVTKSKYVGVNSLIGQLLLILQTLIILNSVF